MSTCYCVILRSTSFKLSFFGFSLSGLIAFIYGSLSPSAIRSYEWNLTCLVLLSAISGTSMSWTRMKSVKS